MNVTVQNFQSIAHTSLQVTGLTVVVGPSDRGKSALLRAVEAALFNRPGEQFVRLGEKQATVTVQLPEEEITWEKGSGVNRFVLTKKDPAGEDTVYSRVGQKAPEVLQTLGFKDVTIGARLQDNGKFEGGETLRPQVARQFDKVFLLDASGGFLNEVLVGLSRLGILQRAGRLCTSDLRAQKGLFKTREADVLAATAEHVAMAPIVDVRQRVEALVARERALRELQTRHAQVTGLLAARKAAQAAVALTVPARTWTLPGGKRHDVLMAHVTALQGLVAQRAVLQQRLATPLPPARLFPKTMAVAVQRFMALGPLVKERKERSQLARFEERTLHAMQTSADIAAKQLAELKAELKVCPVCDKPW